jgi:hypothetical protein
MTQSKVYVVSNLVKAQALCYLISNWLLPSLNDTIPNLKITAIIPNNWSQLGSAGSSVWWRIHVTIILLIQSLNASMCVLVCLCCDLWQHVLDYFCSFPIILILTEPQGKLCNVIQCHFITTANFTWFVCLHVNHFSWSSWDMMLFHPKIMRNPFLVLLSQILLLVSIWWHILFYLEGHWLITLICGSRMENL